MQFLPQFEVISYLQFTTNKKSYELPSCGCWIWGSKDWEDNQMMWWCFLPHVPQHTIHQHLRRHKWNLARSHTNKTCWACTWINVTAQYIFVRIEPTQLHFFNIYSEWPVSTTLLQNNHTSYPPSWFSVREAGRGNSRFTGTRGVYCKRRCTWGILVPITLEPFFCNTVSALKG